MSVDLSVLLANAKAQLLSAKERLTELQRTAVALNQQGIETERAILRLEGEVAAFTAAQEPHE